MTINILMMFKTGGGVFAKLYIKILQSAPNDPKLSSTNMNETYPLHIHNNTKFQMFVCFVLQVVVREIFHILGFPINSLVKFQSVIRVLIFGRSPHTQDFCE